MPYDSTLQPDSARVTPQGMAGTFEVISPGAGDQLDPSGKYFAYFTVTDAGTVSVLGYRNADGDTPQQFNLVGGQIIPGRIRRVTAASVTVLGWYD